ncbi:MAG TPA: hypothetical protein VL098_15480 [Flavipsychrobacter sp.]|nr:hypothetical protein [Flavipsychrobacter sp.]
MSKIPQLEFVTMTPSEVKGGSSQDTVYLSFRFQDGDADIATDDQTENIIIKNTKDTTTLKFKMPGVDDAFKDPSTGFKGLFIVRIQAAYFTLRDTAMAYDSLQFKVTLSDIAGHVSNEVTTPVLILNK